MTKISINSPGGGSSSPGSLQLENGDAMDSTLRYVTDTANTQSKLLLSDTTTKVEGTLTVDGGAVIPRIIIDADTNVARILSIRTNDLPRWALRVDGTESGSNAGSDFAIRRYDDTGAFVDAPLTITRSNGRVTISKDLYLDGSILRNFSAFTFTSVGTTVDSTNSSSYNGTVWRVSSGTVTISSTVPNGFSITIIQSTSNLITIAGSGLTVRNRQGHTQTAGEYAVVSLFKNGADLYLTGDTA